MVKNSKEEMELKDNYLVITVEEEVEMGIMVEVLEELDLNLGLEEEVVALTIATQMKNVIIFMI
jgi:aromatic ring hydroxylase